MAINNITIEGGDNDVSTAHNGTNYLTGTGVGNVWLGISAHFGPSLATCVGYRFKIPYAQSAQADLMTQAIIRLVAANSDGAGIDGVKVVVERHPADPWADSVGNRPIDRYEAAVLNGSQEFNWDTGSYSSDGVITTAPNVAEDLRAAFLHEDWVHGESYASVIIKAPIISSGSNKVILAKSFEATTASHRPVLRIVDSLEEPYFAFIADNVGYGDGIGDTAYRTCDVKVPAGEPPAGGWPVVVTIHGGFWRDGIGSRFTKIPQGLTGFLHALGCVHVNASYSLVQQNIVGYNTGPTFPQPIHDMKVLSNFLTDNAEEFRINPERMVLAGDSAGGHVTMWTIISQGDTNTYSGYDYENFIGDDRSDVPGHIRPEFDLDRDGLIVENPFVAGFAFVGPVDVYRASQNPDALISFAINLGRSGYMGAIQELALALVIPPSTQDELDLNRYISGTSNVYGATKHEPQYPIGYMWGTEDILVIKESAIDKLIEALDDEEFDYPIGEEGEIVPDGLSHFSTTLDHAGVFQSSDSWIVFGNWLSEILDLPPIPPRKPRVAAVI